MQLNLRVPLRLKTLANEDELARPQLGTAVFRVDP
jgi:hypothetical protein